MTFSLALLLGPALARTDACRTRVPSDFLGEHMTLWVTATGGGPEAEVHLHLLASVLGDGFDQVDPEPLELHFSDGSVVSLPVGAPVAVSTRENGDAVFPRDTEYQFRIDVPSETIQTIPTDLTMIKWELPKGMVWLEEIQGKERANLPNAMRCIIADAYPDDAGIYAYDLSDALRPSP